MKKVSILGLAMMVIMLMVGCAPKPAATPAPTTPAAKPVATPAPTTTPAPKPAWQEEWERVVAAAKKEGVVAVYGPPAADVRKKLVEGFEATFPGIHVEYTPGAGAEHANKLIAEKKAGLHIADVVFAGTVGVTSLKPNKLLAPLEPALILPEVKDTSKWLENKLDWVDKDKMILSVASVLPPGFIVNTNLVNPKEFKSWQDLLEPKWRGKIVIRDPLIAGSGNSHARYFYERFGPDFVRAFKKQEPVVTKDDRQVVDWVVKGNYPIAVGSSPTIIIAYEKEGVTNIGVVSFEQLGEAGYVSPGLAIIQSPVSPPHPNALKVFVNWFLSRDGQERFTEGLGYPSRRLDVSQKGVPAWMIPPKQSPKGLEFLKFYSEEALTGTVEADLGKLLLEVGFSR